MGTRSGPRASAVPSWISLNMRWRTSEDIAERPRRSPLVYRDVRRALLKRFPFGVFFRLWRDQVRVLAVIHLSRNPKRWQRRR